MLNLSKLEDLSVASKRVIVRADLDVGEDFSATDTDKLQTIVPTINYLLEKGAGVILIGHRGRPNGVVSQSLSLAIVVEKLSEVINRKIKFVYDIVGQEAKDETAKLETGEVLMLENLRFDPREEGNDQYFSSTLASFGDCYVNEAFSASHREHASIVGIPKILPHAAGIHLSEEITNLSKVFDNPKKPVIVIISGLKEDKLLFVDDLSKFADKILIGGRLPEFYEKIEILKKQMINESDKLVVARLLPDKEDITIHSIESFEKEIERAGTIVVSGTIGKYEDIGHRQGTKRVFEAIINNTNAFKVAGGGDTEQAIQTLGLKDKFDWVSVGGGASLEFLAKGALPGIDALVH